MATRKDLSKFEGTMANVISKNYATLMSFTTKQSLVDAVKKLFADNNINTVASRRLIYTMSSKSNYVGALMALENSFLKGCGLGV